MKVSIADYLSSGDSKGTPIGHGAKVLNEACGLLREYNPTAFAYEETLKKITSVKFTQLSLTRFCTAKKRALVRF